MTISTKHLHKNSLQTKTLRETISFLLSTEQKQDKSVWDFFEDIQWGKAPKKKLSPDKYWLTVFTILV